MNSILPIHSYTEAFTEVSEESADIGRSPRTTWAVVALVVATFLLLASPASRLLVYGFPLMSLILAAYLYRKNLPQYVSFACWLWFLTPLVRRLVDYRAGWLPATAVLLAPVLALCAPAVWLVANWRKVTQKQAAPTVWLLLLCLYSVVLGVFNFSLQFVFQDLLFWLAPLVFLFVLSWHKEQAPELFHAFEAAFVYGVLFIGLYGIVQFFFLPKWDVLWMEQMQMPSCGLPEPLKVRIFSSMNSPQITASFLAAGVLITFNSRHRFRLPIISIALLSLVLTQSRSGWVAMMGGAIYLLAKLPQRQRLNMVFTGLLFTAVLFGAFQSPDLQQVVSKRFQTLTDVGNDGSYLDRVEGYEAVFTGFVEDPFGLGMGATPAVAQDTTRTVGFVHGGQSLVLGDSTIITIITTLGLSGGLVFFCAMFPLGRIVFNSHSLEDTYTRSMRAVLIALLSEALLDSILAGPTEFLTFASIGFCIAFSRKNPVSASTQ